jgi:hypothetical protein
MSESPDIFFSREADRIIQSWLDLGEKGLPELQKLAKGEMPKGWQHQGPDPFAGLLKVKAALALLELENRPIPFPPQAQEKG